MKEKQQELIQNFAEWLLTNFVKSVEGHRHKEKRDASPERHQPAKVKKEKPTVAKKTKEAEEPAKPQPKRPRNAWIFFGNDPEEKNLIPKFPDAADAADRRRRQTTWKKDRWNELKEKHPKKFAQYVQQQSDDRQRYLAEKKLFDEGNWVAPPPVEKVRVKTEPDTAPAPVKTKPAPPPTKPKGDDFFSSFSSSSSE